jgi:hypothetical protein
LDYAAYVWSPHHASNIAWIERVQRSFTNKLSGLADLSYKDRLSAFDAESLDLRWFRQDLFLIYEIKSGRIDVKAES